MDITVYGSKVSRIKVMTPNKQNDGTWDNCNYMEIICEDNNHVSIFFKDYETLEQILSDGLRQLEDIKQGRYRNT